MRGFSQRERQIVGAVLEAKAVKDIAVEFDLSVNTVKDYLKTIYRKAQVHSARELMVKLASGPEGAPQQLGAAVRRCTRARRVSFWRVLRAPGELVLAPEAGGMPLHAAEFAHRILERGWARLEASQMRSLEGRQLAAAGLGGEVIGVACAPTVRVQILLAGDPVESHFGPLDAAVIRLLARLAGSQSDHHLSVLRASA